MGDKKRVVVLFGGRSGEHEVSLNSAASVIDALDKEKYEVIPVAITRQGRWQTGVTPEQALAGIAGGAPAVPEEGPGVRTVFLPADPVFRKLAVMAGELPVETLEDIDVVFPVLHGTFGEDGTVQGLLELANVPYVGAGVLGSSLGMDKVLMKTVLAQYGLPQARFWSCLRSRWESDPDAVTGEIEQCLGYPCFLKPANLGSSVGISKAHNREELVQGMNAASAYDRKIIVEEFISGREVEVSVLGNDQPAASLPGEIIPLKEFYDYEAKYRDGLSRLVIPADLPPGTVARLQELAVAVFSALDCAGLARVDFFIRQTDGEVLVNEINTIPGFTRFSMYPKLWEATGIGYRELLDRLIDLAVERHSDKNRSRTTFDPPR